MIVLHLDSSKSERCAVKFLKCFSKKQEKEPDIANQITLKFFELEMNNSKAWQKNR